ncbi:hypothetical protein D1872_240640 [compost metagenome]
MNYKKPTFVIALFLIITFLFLFFSAILTKMNVYLSFSICLLIGVICLFLGVYSLAKRQSTPISIFIVSMSIIILLFTLFAYLLPEAGYPPLIEL